ncbi:YgaP family membrane protein [Sphingobacterium wenxiniae]|uniref:DUF2892 domain-containing protein n=1 Tax=Sphingobacterium wenxiniae TaxID=683125 RepID=A0A1I6QM12_9SPHI|nr:DUF2892 domain-containing protein [Sphingobacterium wenxiniae]SFS53382.1 Protein of unknown function [Sphingobacterium wenxiniae]
MSLLDSTLDTIKDKIDHSCTMGEIDDSERILSLISGGFILFYSAKKLFKRPYTAIGGITLGGLLIGRAITGKCPLKGSMRELEEPHESGEVAMIERRYFVNK